MIAAMYGTPIVRNTGGLHDSISHLDVAAQRGNGFMFDTYDTAGLYWAIEEAMRFYALDADTREETITRVMQSFARFNHTVTAQGYIDIYQKMLQRPLVKRTLKRSERKSGCDSA